MGTQPVTKEIHVTDADLPLCSESLIRRLSLPSVIISV